MEANTKVQVAGWEIEARDGKAIVTKEGLGGYAADKDAESIASSILAEFATDIVAHLRASPAPAAGGMSVPDGFRQIDLDEGQAQKLRDYIGVADRPISLLILNGRCGYGLYAADTEYLDEPAEFITSLNEPEFIAAAPSAGNALPAESAECDKCMDSGMRMDWPVATPCDCAAQPADSAASIKACQHPDCGRFTDRAGTSCRALRDNACAAAAPAAMRDNVILLRQALTEVAFSTAITATKAQHLRHVQQIAKEALDRVPPPAQADHSAQAQADCKEQFEALDVENHRLRRIVRELRTYNPAADEYKGEHIHKVWAREIEAAIGDGPQAQAGEAALPDIELSPQQEERYSGMVGSSEWAGITRLAIRLALRLNTTGKGLIDYRAAVDFAIELSSLFASDARALAAIAGKPTEQDAKGGAA